MGRRLRVELLCLVGQIKVPSPPKKIKTPVYWRGARVRESNSYEPKRQVQFYIRHRQANVDSQIKIFPPLKIVVGIESLSHIPKCSIHSISSFNGDCLKPHTP